MPSPEHYAEKRLKGLATGPRTAEGKANSSRNAIKFGLFATRITPGQEQAYEEHGNALLSCLTPANPMELTCAKEIIRATWRLDCCAKVEETNEDPDVQTSVDRARAQALNAFLKSTAELRRLQTSRLIATKLYLEGTNPPDNGVASEKEIFAAVARFHEAQVRTKRVMIKQKVDQAKSDSSFCKTTEPIENTDEQPAPKTSGGTQIPRGAPCPCQSGEKYKRCCGRNAPPLLNNALTQPQKAA